MARWIERLMRWLVRGRQGAPSDASISDPARDARVARVLDQVDCVERRMANVQEQVRQREMSLEMDLIRREQQRGPHQHGD